MSEYKSYYYGYDYGYDSFYDDSDMSWYGGSKSSKKKDGKDDGWSWGGFSKKYKSALGWGSSKFSDTVTTKYSSYSYSGYTTYSSASSKDCNAAGEILNKAFKDVRDLIVILDFPYKIAINISGREPRPSEYEDGTGEDLLRKVFIFIPTGSLFDNKSDAEIVADADHIIKVFCGFGAHEAAHLKFTAKRVLEDFKNVINRTSLDTKERKFMSIILNLIEDERVEDKLLNERPGYCEFIASAKEEQYTLYKKGTDELDKKLETAGTSLSESDKFFRNLVSFIRYPDKVDEEVLKKFGGYYKQIRSYINPFPETTKDVCEATLKIYGIVKEIFEKYGLPNFDELEVAEKKSARKVVGGYDIDPNAGNAGDVFKSLNSGDVAKLAANELVQKLAEGTVERGISEKAYFEKKVGKRDLYNRIAQDVSKYVPQIRNLLRNMDKNYDFSVYGVRSGLLDTNKLVEAYQGVPQVFVRKGEVRTNKTTICVLVDESGSMGWCTRDVKTYDDIRRRTFRYRDSKADIARSAAVLLNEALSKTPGIDLYIYGHTADTTYTGSVELNVYREGNRPGCSDFALSDINGRFENRDGDAILEVANRVRKFTDSNCIMFVISDGAPCARGYGGAAAIRDVRNKVTKVQNMGFNVIQVSIDDVWNAKEMFDTVIELQKDLSNFPKALSQVIKKAIVNDKVTTIK